MDKSTLIRLKKVSSACLGILTELFLAAAVLTVGFLVAWAVTYFYNLSHLVGG